MKLGGSKLRICMLTSGHSPLDGRIFYKEVVSLKKIYDDITIIGPYTEKYSQVDGVKIIGIYNRKNMSIKERIKVLKDLYKKALEVKADIYHCHEPDSLYIGYKIKKKLKSKLIYDSHEYHPEAFSERYNGLLRVIIKKAIYNYEKIICSKCDAVISVNKILVNKFLKFNKNVVELPNYPVLALNSDEAKNNNKRKLVYIGSISEEKGCTKIIEALKETKEKFEMIFIGDGGQNYLKNLKKKSQELSNNRSIEFSGEIPHKDAIDLLSKQNIGFCISQPTNWRYVNTHHMKIFEYMVSGIAVIASDFPMISEIIDSSKCGVLVNPSDGKEIAQAIDYLIKYPEKAEEMGRRGREAVLKKYNWRAIENRLFSLYQNL